MRKGQWEWLGKGSGKRAEERSMGRAVERTEAAEGMAMAAEGMGLRDGIVFKVDYVGSIKDAEKLLQRTIVEYK